MTTPTFRQDLQQFFRRYPVAFAVFIFLQSFVILVIGECIYPMHPGWSFRAQVVDLATRSLFFAVLFPVMFRYLQKHHTVSAAGTKPRPNNALQRTEAGGGAFSDLNA